MSKATIFTLIEGKTVGIFVGSGGDWDELGNTLVENYSIFDDVVSLICLGAAKKIGKTISESEFYVPIGIDSLRDIDVWEADSIPKFLDKYALENNYFYDTLYNDWFLMRGPKIINT